MSIFSWLFKKKEASGGNTNLQNSCVTVEKKISSEEPEIPEFQGDYAKTVFLYAMSKPSPIKKNSDYVKYFLYECGIREPEKYHKQMIDEGYLENSPMEAIVQALKVDTLKSILKEMNLPVSGKKAVLVERVLNADNTDILKKYSNNQTYSISEKGKSFLEQHDDYLKIRKNSNWGISWKEYDSCKKAGYSFYDTMWEILNKRLIQQKDMGLIRNDYYYMCELLSQEDKRKEAIEMSLKVLYLDVSGVSGIQYWNLYGRGVYEMEEIFDTYNISVSIVPGVIRNIKKYKDEYDDSMIERVYKFELPFCCCDKELFKTIVHSIMDGTYDEEAVDKKLEAAYIKALKEQFNIK